MRWQAEAPPDPRLLVLNEPLAAELGLDAAWLRSPDGLRLLVGDLGARRRHAGGAGLRRAPVRRVRPAARRRPRAAARRARRRRRAGCATCTSRAPGARRSPAAATAWPRSGRCCASTSSARRCTRSASRPPGRSPSWRPGARCSGRRCCPAPCSPGSRAATCGSAASSTPRPPATSTCCAGSPTTRSPGTTRRRRGRAPVPRAVRGGRRRPGVAGGAVDARRVRPRRDEHRQHDDLRRDHRLRAVRVHGRLRPGHGVQLDRPGGPLRLRQPAGRSRQWNLARLAEALLPLLRRRPGRRRSRSRVESLGGFRRQYDAAWSAGMRAKLGLPDGLDDAVVTPLVDDLLALLQQSHVDYTSFFRAPRRGGARRRRAGARPVPRPRRRSTPGWSAGRRWRPDADAMDRVNPVYIPRNHLVEEALAAATAGDLEPLDAAARGGDRARSTSGPGSSATPRPRRRTSAPTGPSAAPDLKFLGARPGLRFGVGPSRLSPGRSSALKGGVLGR